jgi:hypothetical protein
LGTHETVSNFQSGVGISAAPRCCHNLDGIYR